VKKFKNHTIEEYLQVLSKREPVPGGGSVIAATGAMGVGLLIMAANYSLGRSPLKRIEKIIKRLEQIRDRLLEIVDEDAEEYLKFSKIPKAKVLEKEKAAKRIAAVPVEVAELCRTAVNLSGYVAQHGNPYLLSDVQVAAELLLAAYRSALILSKENASNG